MSETTNKMRDVAIYSHSLIRVRDLAADAIEAVEAQVAKAAKRHEDLAAWCAETEALVAALEKKFVTTTDKIEPAPSAVPAPRGFKKGDVVRTGGLSPFDAVVVEVREPQREDWNVTIKADRGTYKWHGPDLTLVRAADAPEAPAEDAGLVERCAKLEAQRNAEIEAHAKTISELVEAERLVGMNANDVRESQDWAVMAEAEREALRHALSSCFAALECGAQLPAKRMEAIRALLSAPGKTEDWKARAEAAEKALAEARAISAATAERVRSETQIATELRKDLADANDRLTSQSRSIEEMHAEMVDLRAKLAAAEQALDVERRTSIDHDGKTFVHPTREARLTSTAESWSPWMKHHKRVEAERDALRAELSALKAKPRFRTRKVRAKDAEAFDKEYHKREYASGYEDYARAMNAVGLRMRVDGGK